MRVGSFCIGSNMGKDFDIGPFGKKRGVFSK